MLALVRAPEHRKRREPVTPCWWPNGCAARLGSPLWSGRGSGWDQHVRATGALLCCSCHCLTIRCSHRTVELWTCCADEVQTLLRSDRMNEGCLAHKLEFIAALCRRQLYDSRRH